MNITIIDPSGRQSPANIVDNGDGTYSVDYYTESPGLYTIDISYGGNRVPNAPFKMEIKKAPDASMVRVYGPGVGILEKTTMISEEHNGFGGSFISSFFSLQYLRISRKI